MVAESLEREIRDLRTLLFSERDPEGRGFAPLADALRRAGDLGQALELVEEGVARLPDFATGHVVSGWIHRARGDIEEAERSFRRVLDLDEENVSALRGLGFLLADRGSEAEALDVFHRLDDLEPGDPEVQARLLELGGAGTDAGPHGGAEAAAVESPASGVAPAGGAVPIESLAPDDAEPPLVDIRALAPTGGTPDAGSGPAPGAAGELAVVDIRDLAPDGAHAVPEVDVGALAPEGSAVEASPEPDALPSPGSVVDPREERAGEEEAPDEGVVPLPAPGGEAEPEDDEAREAEGPWTRTMAELFVRQGLTDRALRIYRRLAEDSPGDGGLRARLRELEAERAEESPGPGGAPEPEVYVPSGVVPRGDVVPEEDEGRDEAGLRDEARLEDDARLEDLARHMAAGPEMADEPEGPFAWGGAPAPDEEEDRSGPPSGGPVSEYFRALLAWDPAGGDEVDAAAGTWEDDDAGDGGSATSEGP